MPAVARLPQTLEQQPRKIEALARRAWRWRYALCHKSGENEGKNGSRSFRCDCHGLGPHPSTPSWAHLSMQRPRSARPKAATPKKPSRKSNKNHIWDRLGIHSKQVHFDRGVNEPRSGDFPWILSYLEGPYKKSSCKVSTRYGRAWPASEAAQKQFQLFWVLTACGLRSTLRESQKDMDPPENSPHTESYVRVLVIRALLFEVYK